MAADPIQAGLEQYGGQGHTLLTGQQQRRRDAEQQDRQANYREEEAGAQRAALPPRVTTLVVACAGNGPSVGAANSIFCDASRLGCASTANPDDVLYWVWGGRPRPDGSTEWDLNPSGTRCLGPEEAAAAAAAPLPEFSLTDFQRLPLPAGQASVQPPNGFTLVNIETNVFARAEPITLETQLLGVPVQVRATPSRYAWDFGDGNRFGPHADAGDPYPALRITNTYAERGTYAITLTTYYSGEYSVAGGAWLPIDGEATVASPPVQVQALAGRNQLVADTLDD